MVQKEPGSGGRGASTSNYSLNRNKQVNNTVFWQELQREDASWTNLEVDSTLVKDRMVKEVMEMVIQDTARALKEAMAKKLVGNRLQWFKQSVRERGGSIVFIKLIIFSMKISNQFCWLYDSDLKGRFCYYNVIYFVKVK